MESPEISYELLMVEVREIGILGSIGGVLGWDERVQMPPGGAATRGEQAALLAKMVHQRMTDPFLNDRLKRVAESTLAADSLGDVAVNVREVRRVHERLRKMPEALVQEQARTAVLAQQAWAEAREKSDFAAFAPWLEKTLTLKTREIDCVGYAEHPYDALLDEYEPGATTAQLRTMFTALRQPLAELVQQVTAAGRPAPVEILHRHYPQAAQEKLAREASATIGFNFDSGRLDVSVHPFCSGIGPGDVRLTTRYNEHDFQNAFFGTLHETGHGLYEQGLPAEQFGKPLGESVSLGVHESQSRLWENLVGRSRAFWQFFLPKVRGAFPQALAGVSDEDWYRAINHIRPSFIRTEADEATYNLHVLLRFELELALVSGDLAVTDLPQAWNEQMQQLLGLTPPDAAHGVLQDIHWSGGAIGYFPTYTLGNLYAAQLFEAAQSQLGDLSPHFARGDFAPLLAWLREKVHRHGKRYAARELITRVTGQEPSPEPLLRHLRHKAAEVYGV